MLKILDRYIIGKYLSTFFFTVLIITLISVIIDYSEKVEKFMESDITLHEIVVEYYPTFVINLYALLWPLCTLIAVIFYTSKLASNSEILSILNAGVSFRRILLPYMISAAVIMVVYLVGTHFIIPMGNKVNTRIQSKYINTNLDKGKTSNVHLFVKPNTKLYIESYYKSDTSMRNIRLEQFKEGQLVSILRSSRAKWKATPHTWTLDDYQIRTFRGDKEELVTAQGKSLDTSIYVLPQDFVDYQEQQNMLTTPELQAYIDKQLTRGAGNVKKYIVEKHRRTADPFTIFILTIIGVSISARKVRGGLGLHLAVGVALGAIFVFLSRFAQVFALSDAVNPAFGMWVPNIIFASIALFLMTRAQE